jgi:Arc/MetJ-type ribon-helix-helix transcriptional regulator
MASRKTGYTNISIPNELADEIKKIVQSRKYGYSSISEFVKEAVRMHLLQVKKIGVEG